MRSTHDQAIAHNHLRTLRRNRGYAQKHVARLVGCTVNALSHYERGTAVPPVKTALLLEIVLSARLGEIYVDWYHALGALVVKRSTSLPGHFSREIRGRILRKDEE